MSSRRWLLASVYNQMAGGTTLLIFPEGTDLSQRNLARSRDFCETQGIAPFSEVRVQSAITPVAYPLPQSTNLKVNA